MEDDIETDNHGIQDQDDQLEDILEDSLEIQSPGNTARDNCEEASGDINQESEQVCKDLIKDQSEDGHEVNPEEERGEQGEEIQRNCDAKGIQCPTPAVPEKSPAKVSAFLSESTSSITTEFLFNQDSAVSKICYAWACYSLQWYLMHVIATNHME